MEIGDRVIITQWRPDPWPGIVTRDNGGGVLDVKVISSMYGPLQLYSVVDLASNPVTDALDTTPRWSPRATTP